MDVSNTSSRRLNFDETNSDEQIITQTESRQTQVVVFPPAMTKGEAICCLQEIKGLFELARAKLLEFKERRGWEVLNYPHLTGCLEEYFPESRTKLVRELFAAEVEQSILQVPVGTCPASHFRPLKKLEPKQYKLALDKAKVIAGNTNLTASHVSQAVGEILRSTQFVEKVGKTEPLTYKPGDLVRIKCRVGTLPEQKAWDGCWGIVQLFSSSLCVRVLVGNSEADYLADELSLENNNDRNFRKQGEKIIHLWQKPDLELVEKQLLKFFQQRSSFTDLEAQLISLMNGER